MPPSPCRPILNSDAIIIVAYILYMGEGRHGAIRTAVFCRDMGSKEPIKSIGHSACEPACAQPVHKEDGRGAENPSFPETAAEYEAYGGRRDSL